MNREKVLVLYRMMKFVKEKTCCETLVLILDGVAPGLAVICGELARGATFRHSSSWPPSLMRRMEEGANG